MNYIKIDTCNQNNGDGLRCVIWLTGCSHHCKGCFNPETWNENAGDLFTKDQLDVIEHTLEQDWCAGLTLTGGDPMYCNNRFDVFRLISHLKEKYPTKTIWMYSGYTKEEIEQMPIGKDILSCLDVLVDGEFVESLASPFAHWVGSSNQNVYYLR